MSMMVFPQLKPSKTPFYSIINFKTSLTEEGSNFTNGTQTRLKFGIQSHQRLEAQRTHLTLETLTTL